MLVTIDPFNRFLNTVNVISPNSYPDYINSVFFTAIFFELLFLKYNLKKLYNFLKYAAVAIPQAFIFLVLETGYSSNSIIMCYLVSMVIYLNLNRKTYGLFLKFNVILMVVYFIYMFYKSLGPDFFPRPPSWIGSESVSMSMLIIMYAAIVPKILLKDVLLFNVINFLPRSGKVLACFLPFAISTLKGTWLFMFSSIAIFVVSIRGINNIFESLMTRLN